MLVNRPGNTTKSLLICALALALTSSAKASGRCTDIPLSMTFVATTAAPAAMWNDSATSAYQDGVDGVSAAIHVCSGTYDAVLMIGSRSNRTVWMQYPTAIPSSIIVAGPASFAGAAAFQTQPPTINIHNILGHTALTPGTAASFYTRVVGSFPGPDGVTYYLRFHPDQSACPVGATCVPDLLNETNPANINQPVETAWASVSYTPRDPTQPWSTTNADKWIVDGELAEQRQECLSAVRSSRTPSRAERITDNIRCLSEF